jgi:hypothetical protein
MKFDLSMGETKSRTQYKKIKKNFKYWFIILNGGMNMWSFIKCFKICFAYLWQLGIIKVIDFLAKTQNTVNFNWWVYKVTK